MSIDFSVYRYIDTMPRSLKLRRLIWMVAYSLFFKPTPRFGFNNWRLGLLKLFGAKIGRGSRIASSCFVWAPWNLEMGDYSVLGDGVDCYSMDKILIGSKVAVSQRAFLCTGSHDINSLRRPLVTNPIILGNHVWICAEAFVGPGIHVGDGAVVGARSTVVKNVDPWTVVAGNPAKLIAKRSLNE